MSAHTQLISDLLHRKPAYTGGWFTAYYCDISFAIFEELLDLLFQFVESSENKTADSVWLKEQAKSLMLEPYHPVHYAHHEAPEYFSFNPTLAALNYAVSFMLTAVANELAPENVISFESMTYTYPEEVQNSVFISKANKTAFTETLRHLNLFRLKTDCAEPTLSNSPSLT